MNALIVPLTEEETQEAIRQMSEMSPLMPVPDPRATSRERRRAIEKKMIKESR